MEGGGARDRGGGAARSGGRHERGLAAGELCGMIEAAVRDGLRQGRGGGPGPSAAEGIEGAIRDSLSGLRVRQVSYRADGGDWSLVVIHEYDTYSEAILEVNRRLRDIERRVPGLHLGARFVGVSEASRGDAAGTKVIL